LQGREENRAEENCVEEFSCLVNRGPTYEEFWIEAGLFRVADVGRMTEENCVKLCWLVELG
jgi:hypothetical protein